MEKAAGFDTHTTPTTGAGLKRWQWPCQKSTLKITSREQLHTEGHNACREKSNVNYVSLQSHTRVATLHYTQDGAGDEHQRSLMATVNQTMQRPKPSTKNESQGCIVSFLSYVLHGGGRSTCPPNYSIHNGLNDIVSTALLGFQIIVNNLYNDHNDNIVCKVKITYHINDKH